MRLPVLSIRSTVLLGIAMAVLAPTITLWHLDERLTRAAQEPLIAQNRQAVLVMTSASLVEPMWTLDEEKTRQIAQKVLEEASVLSLRLTEGRPLSVPTVLARQGSELGQGVALKTTISREGENLGELEIWFDPDQIERALADRRSATILLAALQVLLSVVVLLAVLYRRLLVPIGQLKRQASDIASRADVGPIAWDRRDELGELGEHLNEVHVHIDQLFDQLEEQKAELEKVALHDPLTGLANRALFGELTRAAVAAAQRDGGRLALLFIDLDRFKAVNDTLGHAAGDSLLVALAERLRGAMRASDVVCRHSGDEFTVLLRDVNHWDEVASTADRLLQEIEKPVYIGSRLAGVSASIGVALFPDDASDHETLVSHADTAMYVAKSLGRGRCSFFRAEFNTQLLANLQLEQEMRQALERDEFVLFYQPQVDAGTGVLSGCEALIRWRHPVRGLVPPLEFIPAAEQCGLISEIGAWTIRTACAQIARWKRSGISFGSVAVNVSALEFRSHRLLDTLTSAMADFGVQPHELEIELTETVLMTDTDTSQVIVDRLHALGLPLAVDDFGTGYSSLAYLKRLHPSKIKIDRSFVRDLPDDSDDRVLVQAIVQLAAAMGIQVIAEGVETQAQRSFLHGIGCGLLQGYLISRPQEADGFERFVRQRAFERNAVLPEPIDA
ncbi:MAG: EAL domain-containing protein [Rhizobacter sp.]|nr:EAL domain-containing protein [Rhizobacter sp.]MBP6270402.1 EAL domain-containing protein [Rhizobacter sp.]HOX66698.1 EAL domain-containing protein [Burkholderiaceae bacterium]